MKNNIGADFLNSKKYCLVNLLCRYFFLVSINPYGALRTLLERGGKELASDQEVPRKNGVSKSGAGLFTFFKATCDPGLTGFEIGMFTGIGGGEGSPGLKVACGTGSGAASCGTLLESLSASALSMESRLIWSR